VKLPVRWRHHHLLAAVIVLVAVAGVSAALIHALDTEPIDSYERCAADGNPIAESYPPVCYYHGHAFRGPGTIQPLPSPMVSQEFTLLVEGDSHGAYPAKEDFITTQATWQAYWRTVHAGLASQPPLLPVDFTANDVIAISEGKQMTSGYDLAITSITTGEAGSVVAYTESTPTIGCTVAQVITNRYLIVKTSKLTAPVSFRKTPVKRQC
jgi:hypothetical protein